MALASSQQLARAAGAPGGPRRLAAPLQRACLRRMHTPPAARRPRRCRAVSARAQAGGLGGGGQDDGSQQPPPLTGATYVPYSAQLLLAVERQRHLERFREELRALHEPGAPCDLTRCALLVSCIFEPQLDHRRYCEALEHLVAEAALRTVAAAASAGDGARLPGDGAPAGFDGLDVSKPGHLLAAIRAVNSTVFDYEGLGLNHTDPHDPLNSSLASVLDTGRGNVWTLAVIWLHLASGLGLPCSLVGSAERLFIRVGAPQPSSSGSGGGGGSRPAVFLVDLAERGAVFAPPAPHPAGSAAMASASSTGSSSLQDEWSAALHAFLRQQQEPHAGPDAGAEAPGGGLHGSSSSSSGSGLSDMQVSEDEGSAAWSQSGQWSELERYAASDAATRNSWKALYGAGALAEWGGSVASPGSHSYALADGDRSSSFGVLESPFATAAAQEPLPAAAGTDASCAGASDGVQRLSWEDLAATGGLQPFSTRALLMQLLGAAKLSLMLSGRNEELLLVLRHMRAVDPFSLPELRDLGLAMAEADAEQAAPLLREYLAVAPGARDADMVAEVLAQVHMRVVLGRARGWAS